jgi:proton glutamate symport protein
MVIKTQKVLGLLSHPVVILLGIAAGFVIGIYFKTLANAIAPLGKVYLAFLNMCILPIIITAIISGLAKIIRTPEIGKRFPKIAVSFAVLLFIPSIVGVLAAVVGQPGKGLSDADMGALGSMLADGASTGSASQTGIIDFLVSIVPWNLFDSLSKGETMSIVFACIFIGIGTGFVKSKSVDDLIGMVDAVSDVFNLLFKWALYLLPIGICCVIADQMSGVSLSIFGILLRYILIIYVAMTLLILVYIVIMWRMVGGSFWKALKAMQDPLFLSFTVNSSFIAIKSCLDSLDEQLGVDRKIASLIVPFTMVANRQGKIFVFAFTALFMAQLYGTELGATQYAAVIIGSSLAGMAAPGGGPMLVPSIAVVLSAINVPTALAYVIFTINGPIVDRVLSALNVQASCLLASLSAGGPNNQKK